MFATRTPINPLAQTLDRMSVLNRALGEVLPEAMRGASPVWVPALEVAERGDAYLIAVDLPGVREGDLELNFENNVLTLRGSKTTSYAGQKENDLRVHVSERQTGSFERSVRLPEFVEGDKIEAHFTDGVLYVTVPKSRAAQPRRIPVAGAGTSNGAGPSPKGEVAQESRGN